jgi:parallel beta-helix repeat protein
MLLPLIALLVLAFRGASAAAVIQVSPGGTITEAVAAAQPGDIVDVAPGVYCENVTITTPGVRLHAPAGLNRAVIDGTCLGGLGHGIHVFGAADVEIMGFVIEHFEWGIHLHSADSAKIHLNEVRFMATPAWLDPGTRGNAILLSNSSFNSITQNDLHDNGHLGVGLEGASAENLVRGNRLANNNLEYGLRSGCNLMLWNGASDNWIVENDILGPNATGIMLGPGIARGNHVLQNRVHGFAGPGIIAMAAAESNVIEQNDARGNHLHYGPPRDVDLYDNSSPADNTWLRNLGESVAGSGVS